MEKFIAIIMAVFAAPLLIGGTYLLSLGGSAYYVIAGITMLVTAFFYLKDIGAPMGSILFLL